MRLHRTCVIALLAAGLGLAVFPAGADEPPPQVLSFEAAVSLALASNPAITAARLRRPVDLAALDVARERQNPEVTLEVQDPETPHEAIGAMFPIETSGKRRHRAAVAQAGMAAGDAELQRVIAGVSNDVRRAYFEAVAAERRAASADDLHELAVRAADAARTRFEAGDVPQLEVLQSKLAMADAQNEASAARGRARAALAELNTLLGRPAALPALLSDDFIHGAVPTLDWALERAAGVNADLAVLDRRLAEAQARRGLARALQSPDVSVGAGLAYDAEPEFQYGWRAMVSLTLPMFTRHRAGVRLEDAELARLGAERQARLAEVKGSIAAAIEKASALQAQYSSYRSEILPLSSEVERMAEESYRAGQTGLVALLQALQSSREIQVRGLAAGLDYQLALADLERAVGARIE